MALKTVANFGTGGGGGGGGVSNVTATSPVISSGGATPNISFIAPGTTGNVLTSIGGVWVSNAAVSGGGNGTPGGANTQIQFNSSGSFGGSANLTWDGGNVQIGSSGRLKLSNGVTNYVGFNAPAIIPANVTWTLPSTDGASGNFLITNGSGTLSWAAANLTPIAPSNYSLPVVSGTTTVGQTLSSTTGGWNGYPAPTYAYQWVRGASNIGGATSATYPLVDADYNNTIKCIVIASNSAGNATANSVATATIAGTVPGAPTIGTATAGNAQAAVSFTAPAVTGGPAITSYTATSSPGGITGTGSSSPITVSGLTNGTAYTFTVTATNSIGTGAASAASNSVTPQAIVQDTYFPYVPLLLETTSTNGQQNNTFLDSSSNTFTITRNGTPTQGSSTPYWPNGQWSNYFNGSSNLSIASTASLAMGLNDFTIEFWVYLRSATNNRTIAWPVVGNMLIYCDNSGYFAYASYGVAGNVLASSIVAPLNTWTHIAISRTGTNSKIFVNGAIGASTSADSNNWGQSNVNIGSDVASNFLNGYLSNLRIVKGTGLYPTSFTPPTTPLTAVTNTVLLTCQSNQFKDNSASPLTITVGNGTPQVQAFQPFSPAASYTTALYGGSGYFNGSTDSISAARQSAFLLGTNNFTIEFWVYFNSVASAQTVAGSHVTTAAGDWLIYTASSGSLNYYLSSTGVTWNIANQVSIGSISVGNWYHVALVRNGNVFTPYLNGVAGTTTTSSASLFASSAPVTVAAANNSLTYFNGYVSNFRMVNGTAVYTTAFTPPTAPVTNITNTSLLLNMTNAGIYDAAAQNVVTTVGDAQASTTQYKWSPTSMKYDGTGDWLTAVDGPQLQLGTGDFTIEGWVYLSSVSVAYGILSKGTATTGWSVNVTALNKLQFSYTASSLTGSTSLSTGTWYYFAVVRSGSATGNLKLYLNGSLEATSGGAVTDNFNQTNTLYVGADRIGSSALNGYLQDVRITKYARTITTPTASFPVQ